MTIDISPRRSRLADDVEGPVLEPGQDWYEQERAGFNLAVTHQPAVIVGATGPDDVRAAVRHATEHDLAVTIHATGHGALTAADGMLVSTRRMAGVRVDPRTRTARVEAGVRWGRVVAAAARYGLAPLNGSSPLVGVVGYTLGGGLGPLARRYGYAADQVRRIELVTADGRLRVASQDQEPDLFWALRGGKAPLGVVTSIELGLMPVARLYGGHLTFAADTAPAVLPAWREWVAGVPDELTSSVALLRPPGGEPIVQLRIAYTGAAADGERLVRPLRRVSPVLTDTVREMGYAEVERIHADPTEPAAYREQSLLLGSLDEAAVDALLDVAGPGSGVGDVMVELRQLGGAAGRPPRHPSPIDARAAAVSLMTVTPGEGSSPVLSRLMPWAMRRRDGRPARYANFLGGPHTAGLLPDAFEPETRDRLAAVGHRYDQNHLFHRGDDDGR